MTAEAVTISIHIKVAEVEMEFEERVSSDGLEDSIQRMSVGVGRRVLAGVIQVLDDRMEREVPAGWRNVGREGRWMLSSLGRIHYRRRIYVDEQGGRVKPIDELFGLGQYGRISQRTQEMGAALASCDPYRRAAEQLSYLVKAPVTCTRVQRMVWQVGQRIADGEEAERRRIFEGGEGLEAGRIEAQPAGWSPACDGKASRRSLRSCSSRSTRPKAMPGNCCSSSTATCATTGRVCGTRNTAPALSRLPWEPLKAMSTSSSSTA
jgi:hypothetical protein